MHRKPYTMYIVQIFLRGPQCISHYYYSLNNYRLSPCCSSSAILLSLQTPRKHFYPSNLFPLWAECYPTSDRVSVAAAAVSYLRRTGAAHCAGGVPTSLSESGQQWDFPNAWPPLQHVLVEGLLKTEHSEARALAVSIAKRYTAATMFSCPDGEQCQMFEKVKPHNLISMDT